MDKHKYDLQKAITLNHLADSILTISQMSGEEIKEKQYYVNTTYRIAESKRNDKNDVGVRRTSGFSIAAADIPALIDLLKQIQSGAAVAHYFVCYDCTAKRNKLVLHQKNTANEPNTCPKTLPSSDGGSFVVE